MSELLQRLGEHGMLAWWGHVTRHWRTPTGPMPYRLTVIEVRRMAQDQELIAAHLQDIHDELRRRGWSTERVEACGTTQISTSRVAGQITPITRSGRANDHSRATAHIGAVQETGRHSGADGSIVTGTPGARSASSPRPVVRYEIHRGQDQAQGVNSPSVKAC
jgi:hypothetical protein